jgi:hypothetical protein
VTRRPAGGAAAVLATLAQIALAGCGDAVSPAPPSSVRLAAAWHSLVPGDSVLAAASALDAAGRPVAAAVTWESSNPLAATVDAAGWVRGVATGTSVVTARVGALAASADVVVAPPVLVGAGDIARCASTGDEATAALLDTLPGIVFTAGDDAYPSGTPADFADCYHPSWGRHRGRTRPSPGNHDYLTAGAAGYFGYFGAQAGEAGVGYYSWDFAGWHLVSLNSNVSMAAGSPQEAWLRADLAAHPAACTLAYWHHPRFSSGQHGGSTAPAPLWQALFDAGADVVVVGHDHTYERFAPQTPTGTADAAMGIRQFVVGTGGAGHYAFLTVEPNSEVRDNTSFGVLVLALRPDGYDWRFVPVAGDAFADAGSGACH